MRKTVVTIAVLAIGMMATAQTKVNKVEIQTTNDLRAYYEPMTDSTKVYVLGDKAGERRIIEEWYLNNGTYLLFENNVAKGLVRIPNYGKAIEYQMEESKREMLNRLNDR